MWLSKLNVVGKRSRCHASFLSVKASLECACFVGLQSYEKHKLRCCCP